MGSPAPSLLYPDQQQQPDQQPQPQQPKQPDPIQAGAQQAAPAVAGWGLEQLFPGLLGSGAVVGANVAGHRATQGTSNASPYAAINMLNPLEWGQSIMDSSHGGHLSTPAQIGLAVPTAGASLVANPVMDFFGISGGKDPQQKQRDRLKGDLTDQGRFVFDGDKIKLADGSYYQMRDDPEYWTHQEKAPWSKDVKGAADAFGLISAGGDKAIGGQMGGWFSNAAQSNAMNFASARHNLLTLAANSGLTPEQAVTQLRGYYDKGIITGDEFNQMKDGLQGLAKPQGASRTPVSKGT